MALILAASPALGESSVRSVSEVAMIEDGEGKGRVLIQWDSAIEAQHFTVRRAMLRFNLEGEQAQRSIRLHVHPITRDWSPGTATWSGGWSNPGGDFDAERVARAEINLARGSSEVVIDVTRAVTEVFESGETWNGLILTTDPADGVGISSSDLARFGALDEAAVELSWRRVPPKPRELAAEAQGGE